MLDEEIVLLRERNLCALLVLLSLVCCHYCSVVVRTKSNVDLMAEDFQNLVPTLFTILALVVFRFWTSTLVSSYDI